VPLEVGGIFRVPAGIHQGIPAGNDLSGGRWIKLAFGGLAISTGTAKILVIGVVLCLVS
jgi:hypothetical protein